MVKSRSEVAKQDMWELNTIYPSKDAWEKHYDEIKGNSEYPRWPKIAEYQGRLGESAEVLKGALEQIIQLERALNKLYVYAHLKHDEDITIDGNKTAFGRIMGTLHDFAQETSWFDPELLMLKEETLDALLHFPSLADYRFHIEKIVRVRRHVLPPESEMLLALAGKAMQAPNKAFSAINDADFKFGSVVDSVGESHELTHGSYGLFVHGRDRVLRRNAFETLHRKYLDYENTLCELLSGKVESHLFNAVSRKYTSCLEASLFPKNIDTETYHSLIKAVHSKLPVFHKYIKLRKELLDVGPLHAYDMNVPLVAGIDIQMSYPEAEEIVIQSVAPLGQDYQNSLRKGFKDDKWVDRFENANKRSGAYSSGCFDTHPYILMNYKNLLRDVFTLAHEAGHSMHTLLSQKNQPYHYANYPIFVAEVASTFNEELLMRELIKRASSKEEKAYLINQKIDDIRVTLFRQTMFAEFELWIHQQAEKNIPLTPKLLREEYRRLNTFYFGPDFVVDVALEAEWSRIPHFYYNFYVYQYATGISAALSLTERVLKGGAREREDYLNFLRGGSSRYPLDLLQQAGVDMRSPAPVEAAIGRFADLVQELEELMSESGSKN